MDPLGVSIGQAAAATVRRNAVLIEEKISRLH